MEGGPLEYITVASIAEFQDMPKEDAWRLELVRGMVVREPRPGQLHGRMLARLTWILEEHVRERGVGSVLNDMGFVIDAETKIVRGPDLSFVAASRLPADPYQMGFLRMAPDPVRCAQVPGGWR